MQTPTDAGDLAIAVSRIAALPGSPTGRAAAMLEPPHRLPPFDGAWLGLRDEEHRGHGSHDPRDQALDTEGNQIR